MASLKDSLFAHYKMNVNAPTAVVVDETGDHHGEYQLNSVAQNTSTGASTGKILGALDFVGGANGEMVVIPDHVDFTPALTPFSISAWIYMHSKTNFRIASKGYAGQGIEWTFAVDGGDDLIFVLYDSSAGEARIARYLADLGGSYENRWLHVVATYDGGTSSLGIKVYADGVRVDDTDWNAGSFVAVENLTSLVHIGRYSTLYTNGLIDNLMFFNKDINLNEVRALYNSGRGTEIIPTMIELSRTGHSFSSRQEI